ncbi:LppM family (lipo)protein [Nocardioides ferulae]|uniref:LppM family (lipo)protein n=1 Tax=Nocardioides ferulae TaxID=2340821 RepID=UPI000EB0F23D|nr:hypothetical protein [Nocardioides ferulae]
MRRLTWVGLVGVLLFVLSGCFKLDMDMEVHEDDTVGGTMVVAMEKSVMDMFGAMGEGEMDMSEMFDTGDLPEGASAEDYEEDGFVGQRITFDDVSLDEFAQTTSEDESGQLSIERDGDVFRVSGVFDMDMSEEEAEMFGAADMMADAEIRVRLSFPGEVTESNGEVDGNTVTWTPEPGESTELTAVAEAEGGGSGGSGLVVGLVVGGLVLLAAVAVLVVVLLRRRSTPPSPPGPSGPPPAGPPAPGTTAPPSQPLT